MADEQKYECPSCGAEVSKVGLCKRCAKIVKEEAKK